MILYLWLWLKLVSVGFLIRHGMFLEPSTRDNAFFNNTIIHDVVLLPLFVPSRSGLGINTRSLTVILPNKQCPAS